MPSPRPGSVTAAAVLCIIYGSLGTLCGLCGVMALVGQGAFGNNFMGGGDPVQVKLKQEMEAAMRNDIPGYVAIDAGGKILGLAEAVALLVAGIALVSMQPWSRRLALIVCLVAILSAIFQAVYAAVFVIPAMNRVFQEVLPPILGQQNVGPQAAEVLQLLRTMMTLITVGVVILYIVVVIYLFIIVMLLSRQHVRAAFAAVASGQPLDPGTPSDAYEDDPGGGWGQDPKDDWRYR